MFGILPLLSDLSFRYCFFLNSNSNSNSNQINSFLFFLEGSGTLPECRRSCRNGGSSRTDNGIKAGSVSFTRPPFDGQTRPLRQSFRSSFCSAQVHSIALLETTASPTLRRLECHQAPFKRWPIKTTSSSAPFASLPDNGRLINPSHPLNQFFFLVKFEICK